MTTNDNMEQLAAELAAEAAERMRIVEDLAATEPETGFFKRWHCRYCRGDMRLVKQHRDDCVWVRARKARHHD